MAAPNQDAIRSTEALPGTWNSGRTTGRAMTPRNSMIPQSVRKGRTKLKAIRMQNSVPHRSMMVPPVSGETTTSGPTPVTTMTPATAPMILDTRYRGVVQKALLR